MFHYLAAIVHLAPDSGMDVSSKVNPGWADLLQFSSQALLLELHLALLFLSLKDNKRPLFEAAWFRFKLQADILPKLLEEEDHL